MCAGEDKVEICNSSIAYSNLLPIRLGLGLDASNVRTGPGLGDTVSAHVGCLGQLREVLPLLLLIPSEDDGDGAKTICLYGKEDF